MLISNLSKNLKKFKPTVFRCNICAKKNMVLYKNLSREVPSCYSCGSTVRLRSIVKLVQKNILKSTTPLENVDVQKDIKCVGLSDCNSYASRLEKCFDYKNTYYHKEPLLDITNPLNYSADSLDFIISTDVFEHVLFPVQSAFNGSYRLLKPGGFLIMSVPYNIFGETVEHFPRIHKFEVKNDSGKYSLVNETKTGSIETYNDLVFHGGPGQTLEMRVFSINSLLANLKEAGFKNIEILSEDDLSCGIVIKDKWSLCISAQK